MINYTHTLIDERNAKLMNLSYAQQASHLWHRLTGVIPTFKATDAWSNNLKKKVVEAFTPRSFASHYTELATLFDKLTPTQLDEALTAVYTRFAETGDIDAVEQELTQVLSLKQLEENIPQPLPFKAVADSLSLLMRSRLQAKGEFTKTQLKNKVFSLALDLLDGVIQFIKNTYSLPNLRLYNESSTIDLDLLYNKTERIFLLTTSLFLFLKNYTHSQLFALGLCFSTLSAFLGGYYIYSKYLRPCPEVLPNCTNLVAAALQGKLQPVHGRELEIETLINNLTASPSPLHSILVGPTGVGKTEVVNGLAQKLAAGNVPASLKGKKLFSLNTAFFTNVYSLKELQAKIERYKDQIILFFDEVHSIFQGSLEAANYLKTLLDPHSKGFKYVIAATTTPEYTYVLSDPAFSRRMNPVFMNSVSSETTYAVLSEIVENEGNDLIVEPEALRSIAFLNTSNSPLKETSQPFLAKKILAKAFVSARTPNVQAQQAQLQQLLNKKTKQETDFTLSNSLDVITEAAQGQIQAFSELNNEIEATKKAYTEITKNQQKFQALIHRINRLKKQLSLLAVEQTDVSNLEQKKFLLRYRYLLPTLNTLLQQSQQHATCCKVTQALVGKIIQEEEAIFQRNQEQLENQDD